MGFTIETGVSALTVLLQGIISFFSPCVLPLVPLYIGYLAGGTKTVAEDGTVRYKQSRVLLNTLFFVIGVSFAFFLLGFGFTAAGKFFAGNRILFARIGGILVILFGLYQLGFFGSRLLSGRVALPFRLDKVAMNPLIALILGFTFSFAWTPCVGPALASVLLMAGSSSSSSMGFLLIGLYTLGFVLPFLAVGIFTSTLLDLFKKYRKVVQYTVKAGGVLLIFMGVMMFTGWMNGVTGYLSQFGAASAPESTQSRETEESSAIESVSSSAPRKSSAAGSEASQSGASSAESSNGTEQRQNPPAPDFTLTDQFGEPHTLSDYKGKVVFLNFWATWCPPCRQEMPDIQALYEESGGNKEDLVVLGIANPKTAENTYTQEGTVDDVKKFLSDNGYTYPVVMDTTGEIFQTYGITAFPTTFMIDRAGNVYGYASGALTREIMDSIVKQTMEGSAGEGASS